jgi:hypothetical protein
MLTVVCYKPFDTLLPKPTFKSISPTISDTTKIAAIVYNISSNEICMGTGVGKAGAIKNTHHGQ